MPLGRFYTSPGQKEEPERVGSHRQKRDTVISRQKGVIPITPKYADTAASYTWGPGKTELKWDKELERTGTSSKLQGCVGHDWGQAKEYTHGPREMRHSV